MCVCVCACVWFCSLALIFLLFLSVPLLLVYLLLSAGLYLIGYTVCVHTCIYTFVHFSFDFMHIDSILVASVDLRWCSSWQLHLVKKTWLVNISTRCCNPLGNQRRTRVSCWNVDMLSFLPSEGVKKRTFHDFTCGICCGHVSKVSFPVILMLRLCCGQQGAAAPLLAIIVHSPEACN